MLIFSSKFPISRGTNLGQKGGKKHALYTGRIKLKEREYISRSILHSMQFFLAVAVVLLFRKVQGV